MTETKYLVSWKSNTEFIREDFSTLTMAEECYREKLKEGKKPKIWLEETVTVLRRLTTAP